MAFKTSLDRNFFYVGKHAGGTDQAGNDRSDQKHKSMSARLSRVLRFYTFNRTSEPVGSKIEFLVFDPEAVHTFRTDEIAHRTKRELVLYIRDKILSGHVAAFAHASDGVEDMDRDATVAIAIDTSLISRLRELPRSARWPDIDQGSSVMASAGAERADDDSLFVVDNDNEATVPEQSSFNAHDGSVSEDSIEKPSHAGETETALDRLFANARAQKVAIRQRYSAFARSNRESWEERTTELRAKYQDAEDTCL